MLLAQGCIKTLTCYTHVDYLQSLLTCKFNASYMSATRLQQATNKRTSLTVDEDTNRKLGYLAQYERRNKKAELAHLVDEKIKSFGGIKAMGNFER